MFTLLVSIKCLETRNLLSNKGIKVAKFYLKSRIQHKQIRSVEFMIVLLIDDRSVQYKIFQMKKWLIWCKNKENFILYI